MLIAIVTVICALISAVLYRLGGMSVAEAQQYPPWKWFPPALVNTKARDIGCAAVSVAWFGLLYQFPAGTPGWQIGLAYFFCFLATFGALTTYWDFLFGYDNFYFHGFMIGVAKIFFAVFSGAWLAWGIQCIACAVIMGMISQFFSNVYVEECGRGATMPVSQLPFVLV